MASTSISHASHNTMPLRRKSICPLCSLALFLIALAAAALIFARHSFAQDPGQESAEEIVANLYAGRVVIGVAKDGIIVVTAEDPIEPETRPPMIVPLSDERVAILLGAGDWWLPGERRELARIDTELPELPPPAGLRRAPSLGGADAGPGAEANDIEQIAGRLHDRLTSIADHVHCNLNFAPDEPILVMVLADYVRNYGPEVWLIQYPIQQEPAQGDFWQTTVLQPQYTQLWPPEKGQPRGLVEISYPPHLPNGNLSALIGSGDPRIAAVLSASPALRETSQSVLNGGIEQLPAASVAAFLRESLRATARPGARMIEAEINKERGIGWFIPPPEEALKPGSEQVRPSGVPSLRRPPGKPPGPGRF
ncbi:MAG TPA: hypothetical protein VJN90_06845 [Candidatus Acidoferrales bacterium]|nr:hypothetical protein [Candidatus Acidoferrales bacterium]